MENQDYYKTLGVTPTASDDEIKRAYRQLARKLHPDVSKVADADAKFKTMKEAYEVLKDPEKRAAYDRFGVNAHSGTRSGPPPRWEHDFAFRDEFAARDGQSSGAGYSDIFESLFGSGYGRREGTNSQGSNPRWSCRPRDPHRRTKRQDAAVERPWITGQLSGEPVRGAVDHRAESGDREGALAVRPTGA